MDFGSFLRQRQGQGNQQDSSNNVNGNARNIPQEAWPMNRPFPNAGREDGQMDEYFSAAPGTIAWDQPGPDQYDSMYYDQNYDDTDFGSEPSAGPLEQGFRGRGFEPDGFGRAGRMGPDAPGRGRGVRPKGSGRGQGRGMGPDAPGRAGGMDSFGGFERGYEMGQAEKWGSAAEFENQSLRPPSSHFGSADHDRNMAMHNLEGQGFAGVYNRKSEIGPTNVDPQMPGINQGPVIGSENKSVAEEVEFKPKKPKPVIVKTDEEKKALEEFDIMKENINWAHFCITNKMLREASEYGKQDISQKRNYDVSKLEFYCKLCDVQTVSARNFHDHMKGKKHITKVDQETDINNAQDGNSGGNDEEDHSKIPFGGVIGMDFESKDVKEEKGTKTSKEKNDHYEKEYYENFDSTQVNVDWAAAEITESMLKEASFAPKKPAYEDRIFDVFNLHFYCKLCDVQNTSTITMYDHLVGKKHKNRVIREIMKGSTADDDDEEKVENGLTEKENNILQAFDIFSINLNWDHYNITKDMLNEANTDGIPGVSQKRKKQKEFDVDNLQFYCKLCASQMGSAGNFHDHLIGKKHKSAYQDHLKFMSEGEYPLQSWDIKVEEIGKKSAVETVIADMTSKPIVGVNYISELQSTFQIWCLCTLCGIKFRTKYIFSHISGTKHTTLYMREHHSEVYAKLKEMSESQVSSANYLREQSWEVEKSDGRGKPSMKVYEEKNNELEKEDGTSDSQDKKAVDRIRIQKYIDWVNTEHDIVKADYVKRFEGRPASPVINYESRKKIEEKNNEDKNQEPDPPQKRFSSRDNSLPPTHLKRENELPYPPRPDKRHDRFRDPYMDMDRDPLMRDRFLDRERDPLMRDRFLNMERDPLMIDRFLDRERDPLMRDRFLDRERDHMMRDRFLHRDHDPLMRDPYLDRDPLMRDRFMNRDRDPLIRDRFMNRDRDPLERDRLIGRDSLERDRYLDRDPQYRKRRPDEAPPYLDPDPLKRVRKSSEPYLDPNPLNRKLRSDRRVEPNRPARPSEPYIDPDPLKRVLPSQKAKVKPVVIDYSHGGKEEKSEKSKAKEWEDDINDILDSGRKSSKGTDSLALLSSSYSSPKRSLSPPEITPTRKLPFQKSYLDRAKDFDLVKSKSKKREPDYSYPRKRSSEYQSRNPEHQSRNTEHQSRNTEYHSRNPEHQFRNPEHQSRNPDYIYIDDSPPLKSSQKASSSKRPQTSLSPPCVESPPRSISPGLKRYTNRLRLPKGFKRKNRSRSKSPFGSSHRSLSPSRSSVRSKSPFGTSGIHKSPIGHSTKFKNRGSFALGPHPRTRSPSFGKSSRPSFPLGPSPKSRNRSRSPSGPLPSALPSGPPPRSRNRSRSPTGPLPTSLPPLPPSRSRNRSRSPSGPLPPSLPPGPPPRSRNRSQSPAAPLPSSLPPLPPLPPSRSRNRSPSSPGPFPPSLPPGLQPRFRNRSRSPPPPLPSSPPPRSKSPAGPLPSSHPPGPLPKGSRPSPPANKTPKDSGLDEDDAQAERIANMLLSMKSSIVGSEMEDPHAALQALLSSKELSEALLSGQLESASSYVERKEVNKSGGQKQPAAQETQASKPRKSSPKSSREKIAFSFAGKAAPSRNVPQTFLDEESSEGEN